MKPTTLTFRGPQGDIEQLRADLRQIEDVGTLDVNVVPAPDAGVLGRRPLHQLELVDLAVSFVVSVAARLTSDQIRDAIKRRAKSRGFDEIASDSSPDLKANTDGKSPTSEKLPELG